MTIQQLISHSGKSMSRIARESGLSLSHVSRISRGERTPSPDVILRLAIVLGANAMDVLSAVVRQEAA